MGKQGMKIWQVLLIAVGIWWMSTVLTGCDSTPTPLDQALPPSAAAVVQGTIVAVGDSLTAGLGVLEEESYPSLLARKLESDGYAFKVINAGISGETSSGALTRIEWVISSLAPDIVILETGANDGLRGIDPNLTKNNLDQLITILKSHDIQVILAGMRMLPNLGPEYTREFDAIFPQTARKHGVDFIPFFLERVAGDSRYNQADRLHPTAQGYRIVVEHIYDQVIATVEKHLAAAKQ